MSVVTVTITSEGTTLDPGYELLAVDVIRDLNRIPHAQLALIDGDAAQRQFAISDTGFFEPGKEIEIKLRYEGVPASEKTVFRGLVITHSVEADGVHSLLNITLKDAAVKMAQVRNNQVFQQQSDDQIIKKLIGNHGLTAGKIAATQPAHAEIVQYGCSDWDFMLARAEANGLLLSVADGSVSLAAIERGSSAKRTVEYGIDEIYSFEMEASASGQYGEVCSAAWDKKTQKLTEVRTAKAFDLAPGNLQGSKLADALGGQTCKLVNPGAVTPEELQAWADATMARSRLEMVRGWLAIPGDADLALLDTIEIQGVGKRFNGTTLVTGLRHRVNGQGWTTDIQFGLAADWLLSRPEAATSAPPAAGLLPAVAGLQLGVVAGFEEDPDKEFRVRVQLPTLGDEQNTLWARLATPDGGKNRGIYFRPEAGDEVVIAFIGADPRQPVILGALYGSTNTPPERFGAPSEKNPAKGIVSKKGCIIAFDDEKAIVSIETPGPNKITLDDDGKKIHLEDQHGNAIVMDQNGITLKSAKDLKLEASANVEIQGKQVDIK